MWIWAQGSRHLFVIFWVEKACVGPRFFRLKKQKGIVFLFVYINLLLFLFLVVLITLPEANIAPENGWLEDDCFLLGPGLF